MGARNHRDFETSILGNLESRSKPSFAMSDLPPGWLMQFLWIFRMILWTHRYESCCFFGGGNGHPKKHRDQTDDALGYFWAQKSEEEFQKPGQSCDKTLDIQVPPEKVLRTPKSYLKHLLSIGIWMSRERRKWWNSWTKVVSSFPSYNFQVAKLKPQLVGPGL